MLTGADNFIELMDRILDMRKSNVDLGEPKIGMVVGRCKNCGSPAKLRQPWLSRIEVVNDGCYLIHCSNEDCHNNSGMEIGLDELCYVDFIEWDEKYIVKEKTEGDDGGDRGKIICFEERARITGNEFLKTGR